MKMKSSHMKEGKAEYCIDENGEIYVLPITTSVKELKGMVPKPMKRIDLTTMQEVIEKKADVYDRG